MKKQAKTDTIFLSLTLTLLSIGLLVLYSSSTVESFKNFNNTTHYFLHQLKFGAGLGLLGLLIASRIDYHWWQKIIPLLVGTSLLLLILVKVPGIGFSAGGATRWIHVGPLFLQPGEIAKLVVTMYIAGWISRKGKLLGDFYYGILPSIVITGLFALLILWQPDFGTMLVLILISMVMFFAAGIELKYFVALATVGTFALLALIKLEPYRAKRLVTFLNPSFDPQGIGYQINQALLAIGAGGLWGYGYGLSRQKHNYLPESLGDSIFAITAEELGFIRTLVIIVLFVLLALRGIKIAKNAADTFGKLLTIGIIAGITIQALVNIGAIVGLLPLTGIPLPFFSYGSSSLVIILCEIGIVLNVAKQSGNR